MTLELGKVVAQIDDMGRALAVRAKSDRQALPAARDLLGRFSREQGFLTEVAGAERGRHLKCAAPGEEVLDMAVPAPGPPARFTVLAADGSQIYPDGHGLAFFFLINVGGFVFRAGSGPVPEAVTWPQLFYTDEQVYPDGDPASGDLVNALRSVAEVRALAEMAEGEPPGKPACVALIDGPLLFWLQRTDVGPARQSRILDDYLHCLDRLRLASTAVAGFVSRPRSAEVIALLYLAQCQSEGLPAADSLHDTSFRGLTDRALFGFLEKGERSALFVRGTAANDDFRRRGHAISFFHVNTGRDLARVEVPEWVARQPVALDLVHAAVIDQCRVNNGYPYALTRADELAVIPRAERDVLDGMIVQAMSRHGLSLPELSQKAQQKQVARWRRSH